MIRTQRKQRNIIVTLILACVLCIVGLFFMDRNKRANQSIEVSAAASSNSEYCYFSTGASIKMPFDTGYQLRFTLNIHESVVGVMVILPDLFMQQEIYIRTGENQYSQMQGILASDLEFTDEWARVFIIVDVGDKVDTEVYLLATNTSGLEAQSDSRSWQHVYSVLETNGYFEAVPKHVWKEETDSFENTVNRADFVLHDKVWLRSSSGLVFLTNIPTSYYDLISKGLFNVHTEYETYKHGSAEMSYISYKEDCRYLLRIYKGNTIIKEYDTAPEYSSSKTSIIKEFDISPSYGSGNYHFAVVKETTLITQESAYASSLKRTVTYETFDTTGTVFVDIAARAQEIMASDDVSLGESERAWLQTISGTTPSTESVTVTLKYKGLVSGNNVSGIEEKTETFTIPSAYAYSPRMASQTMYYTKNYTSIAAFNVVRESSYWKDNYVYMTGNRIVLQADYLDYSYDPETETGTLEVVYKEFQYKDLHLRLTNNDPEDPLVMDVYTSNVEVANNVATLTYNYSDIQTWLYNSCHWIFTLTADNLTVSGATENVTVTKDSEKLTVSVPLEDQNDLMSLSVVAIAEIRENTEHTVRYQYKRIYFDENKNICEETLTSEPFTLWWSDIVGKYETHENFMQDYGSEIEAAIALEGISDGVYCIVSDSTAKPFTNDEGEIEYTFEIAYTYNALFKITDNLSDTITYKALNHTSLIYKGDHFVLSVPTGYRVLKLTSSSSGISINNNEDCTKTVVTVKGSTYGKTIYPIHVEFTDEWHLKIEYFETYKKSFALKKTLEKDIRVLDYPDIYALTLNNVKQELGKQNLTVCGIVEPDTDFNVVFDQVSTYTITLTYGYAVLRQQNYDGGEWTEIKIPLSKYSEWCNQYGQDWSILYLNTDKNKYFTTSNEVKRDELYGFFSIAVFEEQVSDFNYYFKNCTGDGCVTIFNREETEGWKIYEWFHGISQSKKLGSETIGRTGMSFCEMINNDNKILNSYFFYLDGTTTESYLTNGNADNAYDKDDALGNTIQDIGDQLSDWFNQVQNSWKESPWRIVLAACSGILIVVSLVGLCSWILKKSGVKIKIPKKKKTRSKPKKSKKKKKK